VSGANQLKPENWPELCSSARLAHGLDGSLGSRGTREPHSKSADHAALGAAGGMRGMGG
jgi:hypothetical protein